MGADIGGLYYPKVTHQIAGNTSGVTANISTGTYILVGGNNVVLSQNANTVTISVSNETQTVPLIATAVKNVATADSTGTITRFAPEDHAHRGLNQFQITGNTSNTSNLVYGSLYLAGGNNITLSQVSGVGVATVSISAANETQTVPPIGTAVKEVQSAGSTGTITRFSPEDHAHAGVNLVQISGNTSNTSNVIQGSVYLAGGNNITLSQVSAAGKATITISAGAGGAAGSNTFGMSNLGNTSGTSGTVAGSAIRFLFAGGNNITLSQSLDAASVSGTITISAGAGGGGVTLSRFEVAPILTGSAASSHAPASWWFNPFYLTAPLSFSNIWVLKSLSLVANAATSTNSSGVKSIAYTHGVTIWSRQNFGANSTNLTTVTTGSLGFSLRYSHTSGSQSLSASWVTNTTGGTSSFSTTSGASNLLLFFQSQRLMAIPMVTSLGAGEYFIAHRHSTTTGTTNINSTAASFLNVHIAPQTVTFKNLGISVAGQSSSSAMPAGIGFGIASAVTTTSTFAASVISAQTQNYWYANFVNLPVS